MLRRLLYFPNGTANLFGGRRERIKFHSSASHLHIQKVLISAEENRHFQGQYLPYIPTDRQAKDLPILH